MKTRNIIALLLAAAMMLPLSGCSKSDFDENDARCEIVGSTVVFHSEYVGHFNNVFRNASSKPLVEEMTITGKIGNNDIAEIDNFTGLKTLDLSKARVYGGYYEDDSYIDELYGDFGSSGMEKIILPETLKEINCWCFEYCKSLREVVVLSPNFVTAYNGIFYSSTLTDGVLLVPEGRAEHYRAQEPWSGFQMILEHRDGKPIGGDEPNLQIAVTEAGTLKDKLPNRGYYVEKLKVTGPINGDDIAWIRKMASKFRLVELDLSDASIENGGVYYSSYTSVKNKIGKYMFYELPLHTIVLPKGVTTIGECAFAECRSLTSLTIKENVIYIDKYIIQDCYALKNIRCEALYPPALSNSFMFSDNLSSRTLTVPKAAVEVYKNDVWWGKFGKIVGY